MKLILTETDVALIERAVAGVEDAANVRLFDTAQAVGPEDFEKVKAALRGWVRGVVTFRALVEGFKEAFGPSGMGLLSSEHLQRSEFTSSVLDMESTFGIDEVDSLLPLERHFGGTSETVDAWNEKVFREAAEKGVDPWDHLVEKHDERPKITADDRLWSPLLDFVKDYLDGLTDKVVVG